MVHSFSTHGQQSAAQGSSTTVSRSDIRLIQHFVYSAHGLVRRWRNWLFHSSTYLPLTRTRLGYSRAVQRDAAARGGGVGQHGGGGVHAGARRALGPRGRARVHAAAPRRLPRARRMRRAATRCVTAMRKLRIVTLRFGTARQKMVLERWTNPKPQRRTRSSRYEVPSCRGKSAGVA
jgi:hypothetical protein